MTIQSFIEKAIAGGWKPEEYRRRSHYRTRGRTRWNKDTVSASITIHEAILDPLAWQAVGKVEGWPRAETLGFMKQMMEELWHGKTITQFLETL